MSRQLALTRDGYGFETAESGTHVLDRIKLQTCDHSMDMRHTTTLHFDSPVACAIGWEPTLGHIHTEISQRTVTHAVGTEHSLQQQDRTNLEDLCPHVHRQPAYPFQPPGAVLNLRRGPNLVGSGLRSGGGSGGTGTQPSLSSELSISCGCLGN